MTTLNTVTDTSLPATTSQHGSEALFGDNPSQGTAVIGLDLVSSASLDSGALAPPQSVPDAHNASGSKRKLEDRDSASDTEARTHNWKKPKQASPNERSSSLITPRHTPDIAGVESPVNRSQRSESLSLDGGLTPSNIDSSETTPSLQFPSPFPTVTLDLPPSTTPPPRSHSAPPTSPNIPNGTSRVHQFPPPSNIPVDPEPLHTYSCPICFSSPTNATLTPCGHIMCGECLFTAVGAAAARMGIATLAARCPVCRAPIPRWDGRGGGVIGLQPRVVITI